MTLTPGYLLHQRYRISYVLGQGGFGIVYQAQDIRLNTTVAIKESFDTSVDFLRQFEREAQMLARLDHPALTDVTDYFTEGGRSYLVMRYVAGEDLGDYLDRQPDKRISEAEAIKIIHPVLAALEYLHSQKPPIIHRDVKPGNIRLAPDGKVFLVDLGLAKLYDNPTRQTTSGAQAVTPGFAPLEQYGKGITEPRSDLYALGATLYCMLSGLSDVPDAPQRAQDDLLQPLRQINPVVSPQMEQCVATLLALKPEDRYANVAAVRQALLAVPSPTSQATVLLAPSPVPATGLPQTMSPGIIWVVVLLLVIVGGAALFWVGTYVTGHLQALSSSATPTQSSSSIAATVRPQGGTATTAASLPAMPTPTARPKRPPATPTATATAHPTSSPVSQPVAPALATTTPLSPDRRTAAATPTGTLAFVSQRDGNAEIYAMQPDGSELRNLSNHPANDDNPAWSPDGSRIAFQSDRDGAVEIYVMNSDGSEQTLVTKKNTSNESYPAWSPDGTHIVYHAEYAGNVDIYVMQADGSAKTRLTEHPLYDRYPVWSSDGTQIAFVSWRDGNEEIYVMNADGTNQHNLTNHPSADRAPAWSPDGSQIAFSTQRHGKAELYSMNTDGSNQRRLTDDGWGYYAPVWSPDGTFLACESTYDGNWEIYSIQFDGMIKMNTTRHVADDTAPDWGK